EHQLAKLLIGEKGRLRVLDVQGLLAVLFVQVQFGGGKNGVARNVGHQGQHFFRILREDTGFHRQRIRAGSGVQRTAEAVEFLRHLLVSTAGCALQQHRRDACRKTGDVLRVTLVASEEYEPRGYKRKAGILHQHHGEAIRQLRFRHWRQFVGARIARDWRLREVDLLCRKRQRRQQQNENSELYSHFAP